MTDLEDASKSPLRDSVPGQRSLRQPDYSLFDRVGEDRQKLGQGGAVLLHVGPVVPVRVGGPRRKGVRHTRGRGGGDHVPRTV